MKLKKRWSTKRHFHVQFHSKGCGDWSHQVAQRNNGLYADVEINENWVDEWVIVI